VTNIAKTAVVFLEPIQQRLGECHRHARKPNYRGSRVFHHMREVQVEDIKGGFYQIQESYKQDNGDG
jgi:hypothetical protein